MQRRTNSRVVPIALMALALASLTQVAEAQRSSGRRSAPSSNRKSVRQDDRMTGFTLNAHTVAAPGLSVSGAEMDGSVQTSFGPGVGVMAGYGFNQRWSAFASLDLAKQSATAGEYEGSFGLVHFEVGARANLPYGSPTNVPYVSASVGHRALGARVQDDFDGTTYDLSLSGNMLGVGGGIQHILSPSLLIDGGVALAYGHFGHFDADGNTGSMDVNASTSIRLKFGLTWRPSARRPG
jgi:hypothetical protein